MTTKNRVTINLDDEEYSALQVIAERTERSLSWLGRKAVSDFLKNKKDTMEEAGYPERSYDRRDGRPAQ